jgi:hypothetical protein
MLLLAPLVLQGFPDTFVDGRAGLITFPGLGLFLVAGSRLVASRLLSVRAACRWQLSSGASANACSR